jgi:hypothetical protein
MVEKYYQLGTYTAEQWQEVHDELTSETSGLSTVPDRCVQCYDEKAHSPTRGTFLLTDEEATTLKSDPRIKFLNIDYTLYPEQYAPPPEELQASSPGLLNRWRGANVKVYREFETSNTLPASPNSSDYNRTGFQLLRPTQKLDPWISTGTGTVGSYITIPESWMQENDIAAYIFLGSNPGNLSFTVTVQGPSDLRVLLDPAVDSTSGNIDVTTQIEILDSSLSQVQIYNNSITGVTGGNPFIDENVSGGLPNNEIYTINYTMNYTINSGTQSNFLWAIGMNASLGSGSIADNAVITTNIRQFGDARDVDVIVADDGAGWIGHPEFQNNCAGPKPSSYVGGNVLPGNGTCDVLDLVLDAPYYLDPAYFNADPANRLITRWDGTLVPVESFARNWWISTNNRSSTFNTEYPSAGTIPSITSSYTRAFCNGSNTTQSSVGEHCTPCMALTYGRTQGWAYNANKWALNHYGTNGAGIEYSFDIQKIFHNTKPINSKYGTKNPTVSSNSWGYRASKGTTNGFYHFRNNGPVQYPGTSSEPAFISHMGSQGDGGRWKSEMKLNSFTTALDELIESGVIFVVAAGNSNQKQVNWGHPDFNNYISATSTQTLEQSSYTEFGIATTGTTNRRGFPQQGGKTVDGNTGEVTYKTINIGALDDDFKTGKEAKVGYSDRGEAIDFYMPADGTLAANRSYSPVWRYPDTYPGFTANSGSGAGVPEDCAFGGTSAACPVAAGFVACLMGLNRSWTYQDVKNYIQNLEVQSTNDFYYGVESTTATSANWTDYQSIEGGAARVGYQDLSQIQQTTFPLRSATVANGLLLNNLQITYVQNTDRG